MGKARRARFLDAAFVIVCLQSTSVCPMGQPISHSTNRGFKVRPVSEDGSPSVEVVRSGRPLARWLPSVALGVFQFRTAASVSVVPFWCVAVVSC